MINYWFLTTWFFARMTYFYCPQIPKKSFDESSNCESLSSAKHQSDSSQLLTTSAEVNFNNLAMSSSLSRKPSITFNETVFVFRSERSNSSPGINFGLLNITLQMLINSRLKFMFWNWGETTWSREISFTCKNRYLNLFVYQRYINRNVF